MTEISVVVFEDAEDWLRANFEDIPAVGGEHCVRPDKQVGPTEFDLRFEDLEKGTTKVLDLDDFVQALGLLANQVGNTLFVGDIQSPLQLVETGHWDQSVTDAFWQLAYYREVIYG